MNTTQKLLDGKFSLEMQTYGSSGEPLLFIHGAGGLMPVEPLNTRRYAVKYLAPNW